MSSLEKLIEQVEEEFSWEKGWLWLLRKDTANGGYFANVILEAGPVVRKRFFSYGPTAILALKAAYKKAKEFNDEVNSRKKT